MKTFLLVLLLALTGSELLAQTPPGFPGAPVRPNMPQRRTPPGFNNTVPRYPQATQPQPATIPSPAAQPAVADADEVIPAGTIDFDSTDVSQVLSVYAKLVNRTILQSATLPNAQIVLHTQTALTKAEAIQAIQAVLALNNISVIDVGDKFVKAVQSDQANQVGASLDFAESSTNLLSSSSYTTLPNLGTYVTRIVQLQYVKPSLMAPILAQFSKLPNSIFPIDDNGILVIRDYSENVKRMLEMISKIDVSVPAEYISEVIPIRYAKVDDIASALNSLGGGGGSSVSIGSAPSASKISGFSSGGGTINGTSSGIGGSTGGSSFGGNSYGGSGNNGGGITRPYGSTGANGTPGGGTSTFAQRLNNIINGASGNNQGQIQLFGQTKIIPDESSSSLLVFATRQDMEEIKGIIAKLDVPLAQVLIEAVIMDVSLGNTFNFGVSAAQNPANLGGGVIGGGGSSNGQPFANFLQTLVSNTNSSGLASGTVSTITSSLSTNGSSFASALPGGFSYMANIGPNWDVAVNAAESDNTANVIQRPRIQASQAQPAQFFVGETVPYVTSTYNYGGSYGNSSSYSQLSVGVELDVTPFVNPDGVVSMQIQQEIDDLDGYTAITGVGNVPNTTKRTLNTTMTVRDHDTVMLGGFIKTDKSHTVSGVPWLSSIPLLGNLFSARADTKDREELIVLMRPTVLPTPESAAQNTMNEEHRLPIVSRAASESAVDERKLIRDERKREKENDTNGVSAVDFFNPQPSDDETNLTTTNAIVGTPTKAEFGEKASQLNSGPNVTPEQATELNILLGNYMADKITTEQYQAARLKILNGNQ